MKESARRLLASLLAFVMVLGLTPAVIAEEGESGGGRVTWEKLGERTSAPADQGKTPGEDALYGEDDVVRVSIVMDKPSTLERFGGNGEPFAVTASTPAAISYREKLESEQASAAAVISRRALGGEKLDVVWNLTLVTNMISANVKYGEIDAIKAVPGVQDVFVENRFMAMSGGEGDFAPAMATSSKQTGSSAAYDAGYYGAGSRIAIIDTGIDPDHQSFSDKALEYALEKDFGSDYAEELDLLTLDEVEERFSELHISSLPGNPVKDAASLYAGLKRPFNFNYIDASLDVSHDNDRQGAHGSHVAGIAAANRYLESGSTFVSALDRAKVQGVAPDAQILTMKVFGKAGGSYESDHFAAIEDALVLKADVINMSIGTYMAGQTYNRQYADVLAKLESSDTVITVAAGNYGSYVDMGTQNGHLYSDDVSMDTVGNPGAYTGALTVASVDNIGATGYFISVGENSMFYLEGSGSNPPMASIGGDTELDFVYLDSVGLVADYQLEPPEVTEIYENQLEILNSEVSLEGKVVVVNRGVSPFFAKGNAADKLKAKALIIINNAAGSVGADMAGYTGTIPVVTVNLNTKEYFVTENSGTISTEYNSDGEQGASEISYYTGKLTVSDELTSEYFDEDSTISDFSAWGVPGDLSIKPEITAPGGSIYSVDGSSTTSTDKYTTMSGTSMAAPQAAGMAALVAEYVKKSVTDSELTTRQLVQSLLMSTAAPIKDGNNYYPILQQGAGLANVGSAVMAESYITVAGQPDGKVKAELGEDAGRSGEYTVGFTIHNLKNTELTYNISAEAFTQGLVEIDGEMYMDTATTGLDADVKVYLNGYNSDGTVKVPANGTADVTVVITLAASARAALAQYPCGAYIEEFITAKPDSYADGNDMVTGVTHSIPVLAFYGSWTEASMFDRITNEEYIYGLSDRVPYTRLMDTNVLTLRYDGDLADIFMMTAGAGEGDAYTYLADRAAFDPALASVATYYFTPIRNFANSLLRITDAETGKEYFREERGDSYAAFYDEDREVWHYTDQTAYFDWRGTDMNGAELPDGTTVCVSVTLAPELYVSESGTAWDKLGAGATISRVVTVDRSAPELLDVDDTRITDDAPTLGVRVRDNEYISRVSLYSAADTSADSVLWEVVPDQMTAGEAYTVTLDLSSAVGESFVLEIEDYAGHVSVYSLKMDLTARVKAYYSFYAVNEGVLYGYDKEGTGGIIGETFDAVDVADYVDGYIFYGTAFDESYYAMPFGDPAHASLIGTFDIYDVMGDELDYFGDLYPVSLPTDMAYNARDGKLYFLEYISATDYPMEDDTEYHWTSELKYRMVALVTLDPRDGTFELVKVLGTDKFSCGQFGHISEPDGMLFQTLAIDTDGNIYATRALDSIVISSDLDWETEEFYEYEEISYETNWEIYQLDLTDNGDNRLLGSVFTKDADHAPHYLSLDWNDERDCLAGMFGYYNENYDSTDLILEFDLTGDELTYEEIASIYVEEEYQSLSAFTVIGNSAATFDFDGDGTTSKVLDGQALLDLVTGKRTSIVKNAYADLNGDGVVNTFDVEMLQHMELGSQTFAPTTDATGVVISAASVEMRLGSELELSAYADP